MKKKSEIKIVDQVFFKSGNFEGLTGEVIAVDFKSKDSMAIYGYLHTVKLSNGKIGCIEKSEHWQFV